MSLCVPETLSGSNLYFAGSKNPSGHKPLGLSVVRYFAVARMQCPYVYRKPHPATILALAGKNSLFLRPDSLIRQNNSLFR